MQSCAHVVFSRHALFQVHCFLHAIYTLCPFRCMPYEIVDVLCIRRLLLQAS